MEMKTSSWNFDWVVPKIFDEHVKQSVPFYSDYKYDVKFPNEKYTQNK